MENVASQKNTFSYTYSAKENKEIQEICMKYLPQNESELDALRKLDAKVKRPANIFAYVFGSLGAVVMGSGMSLIMTDIGSKIGMAEVMVPGIIIGVMGMLMVVINYPIYKKILGSRRKKYADEVIALSDKITNQ